MAPAAVGLSACLALLAAGLFLRHAKRVTGLLVISVLLIGFFVGLLLGSMRVMSINGGALNSLLGETAQVELEVTGAVRVSGGWQSAAAVVTRVGQHGVEVDEPVWFEVPPGRDASGPSGIADTGSHVELKQGMRLSCLARVVAPQGESDSGYDQRRQLLQQGIGVVVIARDESAVTVLGSRGGVRGRFDRLREAARRHLSLGPDPRVDQVIQGVVTGDTVGIEQDWLEAFRRSGTAHMLSVSGLHVGSLALLMIGLARLLRAPRWTGFLLAGAAAVFMVFFVGPRAPVVRAAVMIVIVLMGRWVGRGRDAWQILAMAAAAILALNPFAVFDVGFQLSFAALTGMLGLMPPLEKLLCRLPRTLAGNLAVSLAAGLGTAPVALVHFGRTSLVSPLANLLVVPVLPVVLGLGMVSVFAGFAWQGLSVALDALASVPMMWAVLVSRAGAHFPVLVSGDIGSALAVMAGGVLALPAALVMTGRAAKVAFLLRIALLRRPMGWLCRHRPRRRPRALAAATALIAGGLLLGWAFHAAGTETLGHLKVALSGRSWPDCVEVRVLDVGQGNAVLVRTPGRHAMLFDGGPTGCGLVGQLRSLGVDKLDLAVISHPHADHFAGLLESLGELQVVALVDSVRAEPAAPRAPPPTGSAATGDADRFGQNQGGEASEAGDYLDFRRRLREQGCRYVLAETGDTMSMDGVTFCFFAPSRPLVLAEGTDPWAARGVEPSGEELNAASLVVSLQAEGVRVLLPGDAEAGTLAMYGLPAASVLMVPHHGSRGAVTTSLLDRLKTRVAVVSSGKGNSFGHPDTGTLALLAKTTDTVIRTDTVGWVSCRLKAGKISITTERNPTR